MRGAQFFVCVKELDMFRFVFFLFVFTYYSNVCAFPSDSGVNILCHCLALYSPLAGFTLVLCMIHAKANWTLSLAHIRINLSTAYYNVYPRMLINISHLQRARVLRNWAIHLNYFTRFYSHFCFILQTDTKLFLQLKKIPW